MTVNVELKTAWSQLSDVIKTQLGLAAGLQSAESRERSCCFLNGYLFALRDIGTIDQETYLIITAFIDEIKTAPTKFATSVRQLEMQS